jgi:DNA transformation protein
MGTKGAKMTGEAADFAASVVLDLAPLGDVREKKMFGGVGVFEGETMFALIDSAAQLFLKVGDSNRARFEDAGCERHGRMPYYAVPRAVLDDQSSFLDWAKSALLEARAAKAKK